VLVSQRLLIVVNILFVLLLHQLGYSQTILNGHVVSKEGVLPGVVVQIVGTSVGTNTDSTGTFSLIPSTDGKLELKFTSIGYKPYSMSLQVRKQVVNDLGIITLEDDSHLRKEVQVKGSYKRGSDMDALHITKASDKIVTVISAQTMQQLPDKNVAEAVQRVAGVKMERNKGEGSNVSLRGTPGDWTATLINGDRLPTADEENPSRTFEFQVFPSNLVDYIFVTRSITPDIEADNIGGAVNFQTVGPAEKRTLKFNLGSGSNIISGKPLVDVNMIIGDISKNKKFSYSLGASYYLRPYGADAMQIIYGSNYNHSINKLQLKDYWGNRSTIGLNIATQYEFNKKFKVGMHVMHGRMDDNKYQFRKDYNWSDGSGQRVRLIGTHGILERRMYGGDITANYQVNEKLSFDAKYAGYSNSFSYGAFPGPKGAEGNGYTYYDFISPLLHFTDEVETDFYGNLPDPNNKDRYYYKLIGADDPYGTGEDYKHIKPRVDTLLDGNSFSFYSGYSETNKTIERDPITFQLNGKYVYNDKVKFKAGIKYRSKEGSRSISFYEWKQETANPRIPTDPIPLTRYELQDAPRNNSFLSELSDVYANNFFPFLTPKQMGTLFTQLGDTIFTRRMDKYNQEFMYWVGSKYEYKEHTTSAYAMADVQLGDKWKLTGGVRMENTILYEQADTLDTIPQIRIIGGTGNLYYEPVSRSIQRSYLQILPSINAEWEIDEHNVLRMALSKTMHRPNFEETKPGAGVIKYENLEITFGTPQLQPTKSYNADITFQKYIGKRDLITFGGYYKHVVDHIFTKISADTDPLTGIFIKKYENAGTSFIVGFEGAVDKHLDFLPGIWSGLGLSANVTYSYSQMQVPGRPTSQALTEQTPLIYNVSMYYEQGRVNTKLALNYTGSYLMALNLAAVGAIGTSQRELLHKDTDYDLFRGEMYSLDYQMSVKVNQHFQVYGEASNLLNAPYITYIGKSWRPKRIEYYQPRFQIGMKYEL